MVIYVTHVDTLGKVYKEIHYRQKEICVNVLFFALNIFLQIDDNFHKIRTRFPDYFWSMQLLIVDMII